MKFTSAESAISYLSESKAISFDDSFALSQVCAKCLRDPEQEYAGREIVIRVRDAWSKIDSKTYSLWNDLCESAGLYPYLDSKLVTGSSLLRYEFHSSRYLKNVYFHEEQNSVSLDLQAKNSVVLSAPTSFGKSLLIEEIIASGIYSDIVIVQPTLALLDETRKKLQKYRHQYNVIVSTTQKPSPAKNVFLFTGERVVDYPYFTKIDFFVIDEFYKLSLDRDDDRAPILNHAFYKLSKYCNRFYFLGPNVRNIPLDLVKRFEVKWRKTDFSTVAVDEIPLEPAGKLSTDEGRQQLFALLDTLKDSTLVYCASPQKTMDLAEAFAHHLGAQGDKRSSASAKQNADIIQWCEANVHPSWTLIEALNNSVAFHNGALPRHLGSSIVDKFNAGKIRYLFCTSTLIEGVNTAAKNVVLVDKAKGRKPIDYFDYRNIAGRSGRMFQHYVGTVYNFHKEPPELELDVDIPAVTQDNAPLELLIQMDEADLKKESIKKLDQFNGLDADLKSVIRSNSGIPVEGQLDAIKRIEQNIDTMHDVLAWSGFPTFKQLEPVIQLSWDNLLKSTETKADVRTARQLTFLTIRYCTLKSMAALIKTELENDWWIEQESDPHRRLSLVAFHVLNVTRHWFDYKLPKLLTTVSNLQKYVFQKNGLPAGDYSLLSQQLENGFIPSSLAVLAEYDIPHSAIAKLSKFLPHDATIELLLARLKQLDLDKCGLILYEKEKVKAIL